MSGDSTAVLARAVDLSRQLLAAAGTGDSRAVAVLDLQRLQLLKSARNVMSAPSPSEQAMLQEIALLNDQSIGQMEHHRRIKGRQLDVAVAGRRAVYAYAGMRRPR